MQNRVTKLFNIEYPIVQAGMIWASGWRLASAVSNAGALGIIFMFDPTKTTYYGLWTHGT